MFVVTLRKYLGNGLSAFPNDGDVAESIKTLISKKSQVKGFLGTGFFKHPKTEYRFDIYEILDLEKFKEDKAILDKELQSLRDVKNGSYERQGILIVNEFLVYETLQDIPETFLKNLLNPNQDYYQQILDKICS